MSTDLRDRPADPSPDEDTKEKPKSSLSFTQVVGGALAAMTAAALGSRLSVAGTVVGAALASVVAAVATAVYTSSLRRTTQTVSTVIRTRRSSTTSAAVPTWEEDPGVLEGTAVDTADVVADAPGRPAPAPRRRIRWKPVLVGALLMFATAAVALTGIELATGHALSGGTGTTVGQVAESDPSPSPSRTSTPRPTPSASPTVSEEPSTTPSTDRSSAPTPQPTASPTAEAEPSATTAPSSAPTASTPSGASPGVGASAGAGSTP